MVLMIEGWACWLMILPLFLIFASIGGLTAGYFKLKNRKSENLNISILVLLPFLIDQLSTQLIPTNKYLEHIHQLLSMVRRKLYGIT